MRVGVVSDWDERLPEVLASLGVSGRFDFIHPAYNIGHAKPAKAAFHAALAAGGNVPPGRALHVGDSLKRDVEGPLLAGMHAVLLRPAIAEQTAVKALRAQHERRLHTK